MADSVSAVSSGAQFSLHIIDVLYEIYVFWYFVYYTLKALNIDITHARSLYVKWLLKYQVLKLLVYFCIKKYSTRDALGRFDGEVIRIYMRLY